MINNTEDAIKYMNDLNEKIMDTLILCEENQVTIHAKIFACIGFILSSDPEYHKTLNCLLNQFVEKINDSNEKDAPYAN